MLIQPHWIVPQEPRAKRSWQRGFRCCSERRVPGRCIGYIEPPLDKIRALLIALRGPYSLRGKDQ
jgi:hypothetical protein